MAAERGRIVLVNAVTQAIVVVEEGGDAEVLAAVVTAERGRAGGIGIGIPPAGRAAIEAMRTVEVDKWEVGEECAVCLDAFGERKEEVVVKEMPCEHRFHGGCIERWLGLHGSCPVCRFNMPAAEEEEEEEGKKDGGRREEAEERSGRRRREMWVAIAIGRRRGGGGGDDGRDGGDR